LEVVHVFAFIFELSSNVGVAVLVERYVSIVVLCVDFDVDLAKRFVLGIGHFELSVVFIKSHFEIGSEIGLEIMGEHSIHFNHDILRNEFFFDLL